MSRKWAAVSAVSGAIIVVLGVMWYVSHRVDATSLAMCLAEQDVRLYGTYWCPQCNEQKALFGRAADVLLYVECSLPDRGGITSECELSGVQAYPTWEFSDGSRLSGVVPLEVLARRSGCRMQ